MTTPHSKLPAIYNDPNKPVHYYLTISDADQKDGTIIAFESCTPFGSFSSGDTLYTLSWHLNTEGRTMTVTRVAHNVSEGNDTLSHHVTVFARWDGGALNLNADVVKL